MEDYSWMDRVPDELERGWFENHYHRIPVPERIISPLILDRRERENLGVPPPFPGRQKDPRWRGCYLYFSTLEFDSPYRVFPLYVGQTVSFPIRLWQHENRSPWLQNFFNDYCTKTGVYSDPYVYDNLTQLWWIAMWHEANRSKRDQLEKLLLGALKPPYNRPKTWGN